MLQQITLKTTKIMNIEDDMRYTMFTSLLQHINLNNCHLVGSMAYFNFEQPQFSPATSVLQNGLVQPDSIKLGLLFQKSEETVFINHFTLPKIRLRGKYLCLIMSILYLDKKHLQHSRKLSLPCYLHLYPILKTQVQMGVKSCMEISCRLQEENKTGLPYPK